MAGLSEGCSDIAAILFALEHGSSISKEASVTDVPAYWLFPTPAKLAQPFQRIHHIDFRSASKKRRLQETTDTVAATISEPVAAGPASSLESRASFCAAQNDSKEKHSKTGVTHSKTGVTHTKTGVTHTKTGVTHTKTGVTHTKTGVTNTKTGVTHTKTGVTHTKTGVTHTKIGVTHTRWKTENG